MNTDLLRGLKMNTDLLAVAVDTETTGLGEQKGREDGIVQIGMAYRRKDGTIDRWASMCNPGPQFFENGRADVALKINNITMAEIEAAPRVEDVAAAFHRRLKAIRFENGHFELKAFNLSFDASFLRKAPWNVPAWAWGSCVMLDASAHLDGPNARWLKLDAAMQRLGIPWPEGDAHRADVDAHAALLVHEQLTRRLETPLR